MRSQTEPGRAAVDTRLRAVVASAPGRLCVSVRADDAWAFDHDPLRVVPSASTIKVPILVAVLRGVEDGRLDLAEPVALPPAGQRVGGAGPLVLLPSVTRLPLLETLRLMVALSDNDATNALIDHARLLRSERDPVGEVLARVPTRHTRLRRRLLDLEAADRGLQNETCAADLADLLVALRQGRLLGPLMTETALDILRRQQSRDGLPGYLPQDVTVAAKPGDLPGVRAETALLERDGRWAVVAAVADGLELDGSDRGTAVLASFAELGAATARLLEPSHGRATFRETDRLAPGQCQA
jgi:beta-lactamase class A